MRILSSHERRVLYAVEHYCFRRNKVQEDFNSFCHGGPMPTGVVSDRRKYCVACPGSAAGMFGAYGLRGIPLLLLHGREDICRSRLARKLPSNASSAKSPAAKCPRPSCFPPAGNPNTKRSLSSPILLYVSRQTSFNICDITSPFGSWGRCMSYETRERWIELCKQAEIEQDPKKLMELVTEINRLLQEEENRRNPDAAA